MDAACVDAVVSRHHMRAILACYQLIEPLFTVTGGLEIVSHRLQDVYTLYLTNI